MYAKPRCVVTQACAMNRYRLQKQNHETAPIILRQYIHDAYMDHSHVRYLWFLDRKTDILIHLVLYRNIVRIMMSEIILNYSIDCDFQKKRGKTAQKQ